MVLDIALGILLAIFLLIFGMAILKFLLYAVGRVFSALDSVITFIIYKIAYLMEPVFEPLLRVAFVLTGAKYISNMVDRISSWSRALFLRLARYHKHVESTYPRS
jgi:hypothetical protein